MDYEKLYKEALERAKYLKENTDSVGAKDISYNFEYIFPELRESEDERIRKVQLDYWRSVGGKEWYGVPVQETIAWLEKQGEQNPREKTKFYDSMDDLIADAMIAEINESNMPESSKHNRIFWINSHRNKNTKWSEEDEIHLKNAILSAEKEWGVNSFTANWLKSLKDRVQPQPKQEWSEEDEENRINAIKYLEIFDAQAIHGDVAVPCINWLKSLKPQKH